MRRITRREWLAGSLRCAAAATVAPGLTACSRIGRAGTAARGSSVTVLYPYDEFVLGPDANMPARFLMFLPLVAWNARGELEGRLAESWEHSPDYRTWTIRLRDGIRWHDGVPVIAQDIKFNLDLWTHPDVVGDLMAVAPGSFLVEVIDRLTYKLTCTRDVSWATPLDDWTVYYPQHVLEKLDPRGFYSWGFWTHPVGNGPYRHVRTVPKTMMEFEANPDYFRGKPKIAHVVLKFGDPAGGGVLPELLSGNVDAATNIRRADLLVLGRNKGFRAFDQAHDEANFALLWNHRHPLFQEAKVRRALTLAINRRELFAVLNLPADTPLLDAPCSKRQLRFRRLPTPIPFDPEQANRLLDEAGWLKTNRKGLRERNGMPFRFTAITGKEFAQADAAVYIQAQLKRAGIAMEIQTLEFNAQFQRAVTGDYEAAINFVFNHWEGNGAPRFLGSAGYGNPRFPALADRLRTLLPPEQQDEVFRELAQLFQQDVPATFLYPEILTTVAHRRIRGLDRSPYPGDLTWCMDQLWLEAQS